MSNPTLASALYYARRGRYVFPVHTPIFNNPGQPATGCTCEAWHRSNIYRDRLIATGRANLFDPLYKCPQRSRGKCPRVKWGEKSTIDQEQIRRWFSEPWRTVDVDTGQIQYLMPNLAVDTGKSNLLVFDCDHYKQNCGDLSDMLTMDDQETETTSTPSGGEHLTYDRQGKPYGNSTTGLPAGFDIRGVGGYYVVVPSFGQSGLHYSYIEGYSPRSIGLRAIPGALDAILARHTTVARIGTGTANTEAVRRSQGLVESVLEYGNIAYGKPAQYDGDGLRYVLPRCPFMPKHDQHADDDSSFAIILRDGTISAGCHHNRCRQVIDGYEGNGWAVLKLISGWATRTVDVFGGVS